ncbi:glycoside hydrolase family 55 protein [Cohnella sp. GbtcB17]|uniref:glycoside hydrolase family 55 protein n=1 Tax=Cohnella sp. GbtcB17 TaxID=2824762 RepID=UPI001C2F9208|nr:glycoside hydrolase family 55 protein [Cohnella sp. GbtcB17]
MEFNVLDYGADPTGATDSTNAFKAALLACDKEHNLYVPSGRYVITDTLDIDCRVFRGDAPYVDSGSGGTTINFLPVNPTDLMPCLSVAGTGGIVRDIMVWGPTAYNLVNLANWVDKTWFDQDRYEMFAVGPAAIGVYGGATPVFENVRTRNIKVGLLLNNTVGHVTSRDCTWGGLAGVYVKTNNYDYTFERGNINGTFCGILIGTSGNSGLGGAFWNVHAGFSPYGIYQCIDDGGVRTDPVGLSGEFDFLQFEVIGEAAIKLLNNASSNGLDINGFGFSWSSPVQNGSPGWFFALPDTLKPLAEKQKYAAYLGRIGSNVRMDTGSAALVKSGAPGAIGSAYIHQLQSSANLKGVTLSQATINAKNDDVYKNLDLKTTLDQRQQRLFSPPGINLLQNVNDIRNWRVAGNGATIEQVQDLSTLPVPLSPEVKQIVGENPVVFKITPNGVDKPNLKIKFRGTTGLVDQGPVQLDPTRDVAYSIFIQGGAANSAYSARISGGVAGNEVLYPYSLGGAYTKWIQSVGRGSRTSDGQYIQLSVSDLPVSAPTYFCGAMVTYDDVSPFSPSDRHYFEKGIYTKEEIAAENYIGKINGYKEPVARSPKNVPFKISVDDAGAISSQFAGIAYDTFTRPDASALGSANVGGAWATTGGWAIAGNEATNTSDIDGQAATLVIAEPDYAVSAKLKGQLTSGLRMAGLTFKRVDASNHFWISFDATTLKLNKRIAGVFSTPQTYRYDFANDTYYELKVVCKGKRVLIYLNGNIAIDHLLSNAEYAGIGNGQNVGMILNKSGSPALFPAKWNSIVIEPV